MSNGKIANNKYIIPNKIVGYLETTDGEYLETYNYLNIDYLSITCPDCEEDVEVYEWPHQHAGVIECDNCGFSAFCSHNLGTEKIGIETTYMAESGPESRNLDADICIICGLEVNLI